mmetsp:Transcript_29298/g.41252  ORF Transcript_29298/g.41252 Transcript_29298/m.41252 type:complete len:200 (+) Transcript_29298:2517-3116(+)
MFCCYLERHNALILHKGVINESVIWCGKISVDRISKFLNDHTEKFDTGVTAFDLRRSELVQSQVQKNSRRNINLGAFDGSFALKQIHNSQKISLRNVWLGRIAPIDRFVKMLWVIFQEVSECDSIGAVKLSVSCFKHIMQKFNDGSIRIKQGIIKCRSIKKVCQPNQRRFVNQQRVFVLFVQNLLVCVFDRYAAACRDI